MIRDVATSWLLGLLFGAGLLVSGMTRPDKVLAFLDLGGAWDPSLAFVMGGAVGVHAALYRWIVRRPSPWFAPRFGIPRRTDIDGRLVAGAALFGVGWGLAGVCPGPGLVATGAATPAALVFLGTMTVGMALFHAVDAAWQAREEPPAPVPR